MNPIEKAFGEGKKFYICEPKKNVNCKGRFQIHCGKQCFCTTNPYYAKDPEHALTYEEYYKEEGARMRIYGLIPREVEQ